MDLLSLYNKVNEAFKDVHNFSAQELIRKEIDLLEDSPKKNILLGLILAYKGNIDDAHALIMKSKSLVTDFIVIELFDKVNLYRTFASDSNRLIQDGAQSNAINLLKTAIFQSDSFPLITLQFCESLIRLSQQLQLREKEIDEKEDVIVTRNPLSKVEILQICNIGLEIDPPNRFLLKSRSRIHEELGLYIDSLNDLRKILETTTDDENNNNRQIIEDEMFRIKEMCEQNKKKEFKSFLFTSEEKSTFNFDPNNNDNFDTKFDIPNFEQNRNEGNIDNNIFNPTDNNTFMIPKEERNDDNIFNPEFSTFTITKEEETKKDDTSKDDDFHFDNIPISFGNVNIDDDKKFSPISLKTDSTTFQFDNFPERINENDEGMIDEQAALINSFGPLIVPPVELPITDQLPIQGRTMFFHGHGFKQQKQPLRRNFISRIVVFFGLDVVEEVYSGNSKYYGYPEWESQSTQSHFFYREKKRLLYLALERSLGKEKTMSLVGKKVCGELQEEDRTNSNLTTLLPNCDGCIQCQSYITRWWEHMINCESLFLKELRDIITSSFIITSFTENSMLECLEYSDQKKFLSALCPKLRSSKLEIHQPYGHFTTLFDQHEGCTEFGYNPDLFNFRDVKNYNKDVLYLSSKKMHWGKWKIQYLENPFFSNGENIIIHDFQNGFCLILGRHLFGSGIEKEGAAFESSTWDGRPIADVSKKFHRLERESIVHLMYHASRVLSFHLYLTEDQEVCTSPFLQRKLIFGNGLPIHLLFLGNGYFIIDGILCHHNVIKLLNEQFSYGEILPTTFFGGFLSFGERLMFFEGSRIENTEFGSKFHLLAQWIHSMGYSENKLNSLRKVFSNKAKGNPCFSLVKMNSNKRSNNLRFSDFSEEYRKWVLFLLWLNSQEECVLSGISKDLILYEILPHFSEYFVFVNTYRFIKTFSHIVMMDRAKNLIHLLSFKFINNDLKYPNFEMLLNQQEFLRINKSLSFITNEYKIRKTSLHLFFGFYRIDNVEKEEEESEGEEEEEQKKEKEDDEKKSTKYHEIACESPFLIRRIFELSLRKVHDHKYFAQNNFSLDRHYHPKLEYEEEEEGEKPYNNDFNDNIYVHKRILDQCLRIFKRIEREDKRGVINFLGGEELFLLSHICEEKKGVGNYDILLFDLLKKRIKFFFQRYHHHQEENKENDKNIKYICEVFNRIISSEERYLFYLRNEIIKTFLKNCYDPITEYRIMDTFTSNNIMQRLRNEYEDPVYSGRIMDFLIDFINSLKNKKIFIDFIDFFSCIFLASEYDENTINWLCILCEFATEGEWIEKALSLFHNFLDDMSSGKHSLYRDKMVNCFFNLSRFDLVGRKFLINQENLKKWIPQFIETIKSLSCEVSMKEDERTMKTGYTLLRMINFLIEEYLFKSSSNSLFIPELICPLFDCCDLSKIYFKSTIRNLGKMRTLYQEQLFKFFLPVLLFQSTGGNTMEKIWDKIFLLKDKFRCPRRRYSVITSERINKIREEIKNKEIEGSKEEIDSLDIILCLREYTKNASANIGKKSTCNIEEKQMKEKGTMSSEWLKKFGEMVFKKDQFKLRFSFESKERLSEEGLILEDFHLMYLYNDSLSLILDLITEKEPGIVDFPWFENCIHGILNTKLIDRFSEISELMERLKNDKRLLTFIYSVFFSLITTISELIAFFKYSEDSIISRSLKGKIYKVNSCNQIIWKSVVKFKYYEEFNGFNTKLDDIIISRGSNYAQKFEGDPIKAKTLIVESMIKSFSPFNSEDCIGIVEDIFSFCTEGISSTRTMSESVFVKIEEVTTMRNKLRILQFLMLKKNLLNGESIVRMISPRTLGEELLVKICDVKIQVLYGKWGSFIDDIPIFKILTIVFSECSDSQFLDILRICMCYKDDEEGRGNNSVTLIRFFEKTLLFEECLCLSMLELVTFILKRELNLGNQIAIKSLIRKDCDVLDNLSVHSFPIFSNSMKKLQRLRSVKKKEGHSVELRRKRLEILEFILKNGDIQSINKDFLGRFDRKVKDFLELPFFVFVVVLDPVLFKILKEREGVDVDLLQNCKSSVGDIHGFLRTVLGDRYGKFFEDDAFDDSLDFSANKDFIPESERRKRKKKK